MALTTKLYPDLEPARRLSAQAEVTEAGDSTTMPTKKDSDRRAQIVAGAVERIRVDRLGRTVAEAAAELGISRQAVHKAIRRGDLAAVSVKGWEGQLLTRFITPEQIEAFKAKREQKLTG